MNNWKKFHLRLTIVLSIIGFVIGLIIDGNNNWESGWFFVLPPTIWGLYFAIRWIYNGLKQEGE